MRIFLDLETIPGQEPWILQDIAAKVDEDIANLKPPRNYKSEDAIAKWKAIEGDRIRSEANDRFHRCGLDGGRGEICSIAWAIDDHPVESFARGPEDDAPTEAALIAGFFAAITGATPDALLTHTDENGAHTTNRSDRLAGAQWVGHNVMGFDIPFLWKRCVVLNIRPPLYFPNDAAPWDRAIFDTMLEWAGYKGRVSQDSLCKSLGLPVKEGITGADVYQTWLNADIDIIETYNRQDVETVRAIYKRLNFVEIL